MPGTAGWFPRLADWAESLRAPGRWRGRGRNGRCVACLMLRGGLRSASPRRLAETHRPAVFCSWKGLQGCIRTGSPGPHSRQAWPCGLLGGRTAPQDRPAAWSLERRGVGWWILEGPGPSRVVKQASAGLGPAAPAEHRTFEIAWPPGSLASWLPAQSGLRPRVG